MVCPSCSIQCRQYKEIGEGSSDYDYYDTAEVKECPKCEKKFVEFYVTFEINDNTNNHLSRVVNVIKRLIKIIQNT